MEFWPADFRADVSASTKEKRKGKEVYRLNGQSIEPGTLGAATLILGQAPPTWITAVQPHSRYFPRSVGDPVEVFPPTKPPPIRVPKMTTHRRAEHGARFLRTYFPDVDVSFELIRDELQLDEKEAAANSPLDPYASNRLVHFSIGTRQQPLTPCLAFACGETGSELNVSAFRFSKDKRSVFAPSATPTMTFDTPIQQIAAFTPMQATKQTVALLAVRTHAVVSLVKLHSSAGVDIRVPPVAVKTVLPIPLSETGKRRIVDMSCRSLSSSNNQILLVNDIGTVYNGLVLGGSKAVSPISEVPADDGEELGHDRFWRLAFNGLHSCIRVSSKKAHSFDLRMQNIMPEEVFCLADGRECLTSLEAPSNGHHTMCFSTTNRILWYDERNFKRPILTLKHQRAFDRSLRVQSVIVGQSTLTTLSSAANHLVTLYDVNYTSSGHLQVHGMPSLLPGSSEVDLPILGSLCFQPSGAENSDYYHFQLSARGSLWKTAIRFPSEDVEQASDNHPKDFEWTDEMHELAKMGKAMTEDTGSLGNREHVVANLRTIYEKIYDVRHDVSQVAEEDFEAVYDTLEKMPFFWQDMDGATEQMLTTFDIAFQCGPEPPEVGQADFLNESVLSSNRGYMALIEGRIPIPRLISTVSWHHDLSSLPSAIVPDMSTPSQSLFNKLREEAVAQAGTPQGMQRATEAAQRVVLDLALSRHVFAPQFHPETNINVKSDEADSADMLSRATKALCLDAAEPSPLHFGFLHPIAKVPPEEDQYMENQDSSDGDSKLHVPPGVRLLLSQWNVGSSPEDYAYKDPYGVQDTSPTPMHVSRRGTRNMTRLAQQASIPTVVTARPPIVVSSTSRHKLTGRSRPPTQTTSTFENHAFLRSTPARQPQRWDTGDSISFRETQGGFQDPTSVSQDVPEPSTQPLPGPFGGGSRKQRGSKKRIGGF